MRVYPVFLSLVLILGADLVNAQSFYAIRRERSLIATVGTGTANYFGDLVNPGTLGKLRPNIIVGAEYYFTNRISTRAELTWFQLAGDDADADDDRKNRNLSFFSNNIELSTVGTISMLPLGQRFYQRPKFNLYAFAGIGLLFTNPKTERQNGEVVALQPLKTEDVDYSRFQPVIPYGLGIKYMYDPFFNILLEAGYRLTFTDYLDDVSIKRYPDVTGWEPIRAELSDRRVEIGTQPPNPTQVGVRGNPDNNDGYFLLNVKVQYYLPQEFKNSQRKLYNRKRKAYYKKRR